MQEEDFCARCSYTFYTSSACYLVLEASVCCSRWCAGACQQPGLPPSSLATSRKPGHSHLGHLVQLPGLFCFWRWMEALPAHLGWSLLVTAVLFGCLHSPAVLL